MKTIVLSQAIHPAGHELIKDKFNVVVPADLSQEAFQKAASQADAIILRTNVKVTKEIIESAPNLKIISRTGAGVDNIDLEAADAHNVLVCNLPGANNVSVAEHAVSMMTALAKQLPLLDKSVRNEGQWQLRHRNYPVEMNGKTLGVVGLGAIGALVAGICANGYDMQVLAYDPFVDQSRFSGYAFSDTLAELFAKSDFITLHCPSLPQTKGMITRELLFSMKPEAFLVNCSRGDVLDTKALFDLLNEHRIAGAALDVFEKEPPDLDDPLLSSPNVIVSPHAAALTKEASTRMSTEACRQVISYFETGKPLHIYGKKRSAME